MPLRMRIGTTIFHNIREKKLSFSYSPCRESSKVSPELSIHLRKLNLNCYNLDNHGDATGV